MQQPRPPPTSPNHASLGSLADKFAMQRLSPGRFLIECVEANNVRRKDQTTTATSLRVYIVFKFGSDLDSVTATKRTRDCIKSRTSELNFGNEVLSFDVQDPMTYLSNNDIKLKLELWDSPEGGTDVFLAGAVLSVIPFMCSAEQVDESIEIKHTDDASSNSKVRLRFQFHRVKCGMLIAKPFSLTKVPTDVKDVHISMKLQNEIQTKRSKTIHDDGDIRYFGEGEVLLWIDKTNWFQDLDISLCDENERTLGVHSNFSPIPYMLKVKDDSRIVSFQEPHGSTRGVSRVSQMGEVLIKFEFLPAGELTVQVIEGRNVMGVDVESKIEPYIAVTSEGKASTLFEKTSACKEGSGDPKWNQSLTLMVVDHHSLRCSCRNHDAISGDDELIGEAELSLLPVYKMGSLETWVGLRSKNEFGADVDAGKVRVALSFKGESGIAFPQRQPGMASYDEKERVNRAPSSSGDYLTDSKIESPDRKIKSTKLGEPGGYHVAASVIESPYDCGFTDEEIRKSFEFLDLDKNGFIGASELRHILFYMGELVTDEEIDMMIRMLDENGDGQVNADEFMSMVKDPDPSRNDFLPSKSKERRRSSDINGESNSAESELQKRELKRELLSAMASSQAYRRERYLKLAKDVIRFSALDNGSRQWRVTMQEMARVFSMNNEAAETRKLFETFELNKTGIVDLRQILLGLSNFISTLTTEDRCRVAFDFYDEDSSGFLTQDEIEQLLVGSHLQSRNAVLRKAKTVMAYADPKNAGGINVNELLQVATKFPNLLFPIGAFNQLN